MGSSVSAPEPANVDLLPPRMDATTQGISRLSTSPFGYAFGQASRDALFRNFFAEDTGRVRLHLSPPTDDRVRIAMDLQARDGMITSASAGAAIADSLPSGQLVEACGTVGSSEPITLRGTAVDPALGLAVYGRFPLSDSLSRRVVAAPPAISGSASAAEDPVGPALEELDAPRTMPASHLVGRLSNAFHVAGGDLNSVPRPDVMTATPAPTTAAGTDSAAAAGGAVTSAKSSRTAGNRVEEWPEVGAAWSSANGAASAGVHMGIGPGKPAKGWLLATSGGFSAGIQASLFAGDAWQRLRTAGGVGLQTPFGMTPGPAGSGSPLPVDIDVAMCLKSSPVFHAALMFESAKRELMVAYQHHITFRRSVYNPMEERHVKGIFNYVDIGVEFRQPLTPDRDPGVAVAGAWQLNRHLMIKGKAGTSGAAVSASARGWSSPDLSLTASMGVAPPANTSLLNHRGEPYAGVFLSLGNAAAPPAYRKIVLGEHQQAKYRQFRAQPGMSSSRTDRVEANSTQPGPARSRRMPTITLDDDAIMPGRSSTRA